jgi:serine-aspartate repeat-containing protein C/D/E
VTINVLANDSDAECPAGLQITGISGLNSTTEGTAQIVNNKIVFTPANGVTGTIKFYYTIADGCGGTDTAEVTVVIGSPPPPPPPPPPVSPLVIDLHGDGIHLIARDNNSHGFDLTGDGKADDTAWFSPTDGILARDYDGNGTIDGIHEVFGNAEMDGYSELRMLEDTNSDGVIDANDAGWDQLRVWVDANSDGISQAEELYGLAHFGIVSIDAMGTENYIGMGDEAFISHTGSVTLADGSTLDTADVWFNLPSSSATGNGDEIVIDPAVLAAATGDDVAAMPAQTETAPTDAYVAPVVTTPEEQTQIVLH